MAGGSGSRLFPANQAVCKQLMPVYDKPMIYYPLTTLMDLGIRDILIITNPQDMKLFIRCLGDGSNLGIRISYEIQLKPEGIAQALIIAENFIGQDQIALILGDNIFHGVDASSFFPAKRNLAVPCIFALWVNDPSRYGVVNLDEMGRPISVEEKPTSPSSHYAVTGLYFYENEVIQLAKTLQKSHRNEYEISDINNIYAQNEMLDVTCLHGTIWFDAGTHDSLMDAAQYIAAIQKRTGVLIGSPEASAFLNGFITRKQFDEILSNMSSSSYRNYLECL